MPRTVGPILTLCFQASYACLSPGQLDSLDLHTADALIPFSLLVQMGWCPDGMVEQKLASRLSLTEGSKKSLSCRQISIPILIFVEQII